MVYKQILGIGGLCQVADQVKRRYGFHSASPFDALVTPLRAVSRVIEDGGRSLGLDSQLINDGTLAVSSNYGVAYHHEFRREEGEKVVLDDASARVCHEKLSYKHRRFVESLSSGVPTLLIRMVGHHDCAYPFPYIDDPTPVSGNDLNSLAGLFARKFPDLPFGIAFAYVPKHTSFEGDFSDLDSRVRLFEFSATEDWKGKDAEWDSLFDSYEIGIEKRDE